MKVILLKDVRGVGMHGTVQTVADGYAINKLFPARLAEPATEEKMKQIEAKRAELEAQRQKEQEQLDAKVQSLRGKKVALQTRATEKGGLFKSVGEREIAKAILEEHSLEIPESAIRIQEPIKTIGEHTVQLQSANHTAEVSVAIAAGI